MTLQKNTITDNQERLYANWDSYWNGFMSNSLIETVRFSLIKRTCNNLLRGTSFEKGAHFCEIGAGTGSVSCYLGKKYGADVTVVDSNLKALKMCEETFHHFPSNMYSVNRDAFSLDDYHGKFDLVTSGGLIEHFVGDMRSKIIQVHCDLVKPGGAILILVPIVNFWYRILNYGIFKWLHLLDEIKEVPWSYKELEMELADRGFTIVSQDTVVSELGVLAKRKGGGQC